MPLLKLQLSTPLDGTKKLAILKELSALTAKGLGKPEKYVMVVVDEGSFIMAGESAPAAFAVVRGIGGINPATNKAFSRLLCDYLKAALAIPTERVYINFADVDADNWGWNGSTFG
jgi:phenylpyruvate tautomerase